MGASKKKPETKLTGGKKLRKWFRMVILLTVKKYGGRILSHLFFAYLLTEMTRDMHLIWKDFAEYKNCQDAYVESISTNVSRQYNEAADALAESILVRAKCLTKGLDLDMPKPFPDIPLGSLPKGWFKKVFGWFSPIDINIPEAELDIKSNTEEVVDSINDDIHIFTKIGFWTRLAGFILAIISIFMILATATYYTIANKIWKPSLKSHVLRFVQFTQVVGAYVVASLTIFLQAYATDKFCKVSIDDAELKTPKCEVQPTSCDFECELVSHRYPSTCKQCSIKFHWWWVEPFSMPNIFGAAYIGFMIMVLVFECCEAAYQFKQARKTKQQEREERRNARLKSEAKKSQRLQESLLQEQSNQPDPSLHEKPVSEISERSDPPRPKRKKKKSRNHTTCVTDAAPSAPSPPVTTNPDCADSGTSHV